MSNRAIDVSSFLQGRFFKSEDIPRQGVEYTINCVTEEMMRDGTRKPALSFKGEAQLLALNVTNLRIIAGAYGRNASQWIGQPVFLRTVQVDFKGTPTTGIRVEIPDDPVQASLDAQAPHQGAGGAKAKEETFDDDIPF